jgi:hypothetical protein
MATRCPTVLLTVRLLEEGCRATSRQRSWTLDVTPRSGKSGKHLSNYHILLPVEGVVYPSATYQMHVRASTAHRLTIANRTVPYGNFTLHARIQRATTPPGLCA